MTSNFEISAARVIIKALARLGLTAIEAHQNAALRDQARTFIAASGAARIISALPLTQAVELNDFIDSPDFEQIALCLILARRDGEDKPPSAEANAEIREMLRQCLRQAVSLDPEDLFPVTDVLFDSLSLACYGVTSVHLKHRGGVSETRANRLDRIAVAAQAHLAAMAARNSALLGGLSGLVANHEAADRLRAQVRALHAELRLPHTGVSRTVAWDLLYVPHLIAPEITSEPTPTPERLVTEGQRTVILGDPGAGKSTLITKLAFDVATATRPRVPFLVVLRDLSEALTRGGRTLAQHMASVARSPYNVNMSSETVEYLLLNGRAVVLLDGLDELLDASLRSRVAQLVDGFATLHPLTPIVVTSRSVGYHEAPLDSRLFRTCRILRFDDGQVEAYAKNWFSQNDALPVGDRDRLCEAFLEESQTIEDLRANPLLLSLLTAMYATEQYIPRSRAQVYERCAVMMYEQWESMRGFKPPIQFQGHVRGSVQRLAWYMFAEKTTLELPRRYAEKVICQYLQSRRFDEDEAHAMADRFLAFCTGRSWVLAEVGATEVEPIYGFAHRTFLEYFTAEYMVRHHQTPERVWTEVRGRLAGGEWLVVAQLALQLLDRNIEDGAESLVGLALDELGRQPQSADALLLFLATACGHVALSPETVFSIANAIFQTLEGWDVDRWHEFRLHIMDDRRAPRLDEPIYALADGSLAANLPYIEQSLNARLPHVIQSPGSLDQFAFAIRGRR